MFNAASQQGNSQTAREEVKGDSFRSAAKHDLRMQITSNASVSNGEKERNPTHDG